MGSLFQPDGSGVQSLNNTLQPVWDWIEKHPDTTVSTFGSMEPSVFSFAQKYISDAGVAANTLVGSRLIPRSVLQKKPKQLTKFTLGESPFLGSMAVVGKQMSTLVIACPWILTLNKTC